MISTSFTAQNKKIIKKQSFNFATLAYHDIFDFPLTKEEIVRWQTSLKSQKTIRQIKHKSGFYFLAGREILATKRKFRESVSKKKLSYAKKVAKVLSHIPTIQMIGITGSLAMMNADNSSDVDFMIITKKNTLWTTRLLTLATLKLKGFSTRRFGDKNQKNKICLNLWLDESDLIWRKRNIFTAHEIAQVLPILEKDWTHQEFLRKNRWIKKYWPNGAMFLDQKFNKRNRTNFSETLLRLVEPLSFLLQKLYMKGKITNEKVSRTRAAFHPVNLSKFVSKKFIQTS